MPDKKEPIKLHLERNVASTTETLTMGQVDEGLERAMDTPEDGVTMPEVLDGSMSIILDARPADVSAAELDATGAVLEAEESGQETGLVSLSEQQALEAKRVRGMQRLREARQRSQEAQRLFSKPSEDDVEAMTQETIDEAMDRFNRDLPQVLAQARQGERGVKAMTRSLDAVWQKMKAETAATTAKIFRDSLSPHLVPLYDETVSIRHSRAEGNTGAALTAVEQLGEKTKTLGRRGEIALETDIAAVQLLVDRAKALPPGPEQELALHKVSTTLDAVRVFGPIKMIAEAKSRSTLGGEPLSGWKRFTHGMEGVLMLSDDVTGGTLAQRFAQSPAEHPAPGKLFTRLAAYMRLGGADVKLYKKVYRIGQFFQRHPRLNNLLNRGLKNGYDRRNQIRLEAKQLPDESGKNLE